MTLIYYSGNRIKGLSTDTKPTTVQNKAIFHETDTGSIYDFDGSSWTERSVGASATDIIMVNGKALNLREWVLL